MAGTGGDSEQRKTASAADPRRETDEGMYAASAIVNRHDDREPEQERRPACWQSGSPLQNAGDSEDPRTLKGNKAHGRSEQFGAGNGEGLQRTHQLRKALKSRRSPGAVLNGSSGNRRYERCQCSWSGMRQQHNGFARWVRQVGCARPGLSRPISVGIGDAQVDGSHLRGVTGPICDNTHQLAGGWMAGTL
jgi:hypothetical protein